MKYINNKSYDIYVCMYVVIYTFVSIMLLLTIFLLMNNTSLVRILSTRNDIHNIIIYFFK